MSIEAMVPAHVNAAIAKVRSENPFELNERESQLLGRYKLLLVGPRAKDPTVPTTPETIKVVLDYVARTQAWYKQHTVTAKAPVAVDVVEAPEPVLTIAPL